MTAFVTPDVDAEFERPSASRSEAPVGMGPIRAVVFEDTCGSLTNRV